MYTKRKEKDKEILQNAEPRKAKKQTAQCYNFDGYLMHSQEIKP